jgi:hypothetical protein
MHSSSVHIPYSIIIYIYCIYIVYISVQLPIIAVACIMDDSNDPQVESGASSHVSQSHQKNQVPYCHIIAPLLLFDSDGAGFLDKSSRRNGGHRSRYLCVLLTGVD